MPHVYNIYGERLTRCGVRSQQAVERRIVTFPTREIGDTAENVHFLAPSKAWKGRIQTMS